VSRRTAIWLVPVLLMLHNAEEALLFPRYLPLALARLPEGFRAVAGAITLGQVGAALALVTAVPFGLAAWAAVSPSSRLALWLLLLVQATVLLNVFWHLATAVIVFQGYAPGLITAVALNFPSSIYLLRRAQAEQWVGPAARWALVPGALVLHGPLLSGLILLTERS
jgi:heme/copper-type cytochrome/quinol oxidase subunit 4